MCNSTEGHPQIAQLSRVTVLLSPFLCKGCVWWLHCVVSSKHSHGAYVSPVPQHGLHVTDAGAKVTDSLSQAEIGRV